jgi:hypothetical protein
VLAIIGPDIERESKRGRKTFRDAMHVATAIRYAADAFVTREQRLLGADTRVTDEFDGFRVMSPERALAFVDRMKVRYETRTE